MIKILYIMRNMDIGGAETFLLSMLQKIDRREFQPEVLSIYGGGVLQKEFEDIGIPTIIMQFTCQADLKSYAALIRLMKQRQYDIVHTKLFHADIVGRICAMFARTRAVFSTVENIEDWDKKKSLRQTIKVWTARATARINYRVIAVAEVISVLLVRQVGIQRERVEVIHNGVDIEAYNPDLVSAGLKKELGIPEHYFLVGAIGTLNPTTKRQKTLIDAAALVCQKRGDVRFVIVGRGDQRELRQRAKEQGVAHVVHLTGARRDITRILKSLDIYVMTSRTEGLSISLIEAMSMKKAVIATRVGGNPEIINNEDAGILLPPDQPELFAEMILRLLDDPQKRALLGENARRRVEEHFNLASTVPRYEQLYRTSVGL